MKDKVRRWDSVMWLFVKGILYFLLMGTFLVCLGKESHSLRALSRTLGITVTTFLVVEMLFVSIYGKYDVGRKKSKPIIISLGLATFFTDIITYIQLMIMRTNVQSIYAFRIRSISWLLVALAMQLLLITIFVYVGNEVFFLINKPERSCVVTGRQKDLNAIMRVISKYQRQYRPEQAFDYRDPDILSKIEEYETVFIYEVPIEQRTKIVRYCYQEKKDVYYNPELHDIMEFNAEYYVLDDVSLLNSRTTELTMEQRIVKRTVDLVLAILIGVLSLPFSIGAAIAIKCYDGGSIFFKQKRATLNGRIFEVYKFRTMKENVEHKSARKGDSRITRPGKFLRKTRIDELPQLINIIKGDMSFVGPRPEMIENVTQYTKILPEFKYRLRVKAGLTGYAQVAGKYNTTPKDKLMMDIMYIENYSIFKDIQLLFQTVGVVLKSDSTEAFGEEEGQEPLKLQKFQKQQKEG